MKKSNIKKEIKHIISRLKKVAVVKNDIELAQIMNTNQNTFSSWKNQNYQIPLDNLIDFCNLYKVSLNYILFGESDDIENLLIPFFENFENFIHNQNEWVSKKHIVIPKTYANNIDHSLVSFQTVDNQLPYTAPKGSYIIVDTNNKDAGWGCEMFLISTDYGYLVRKLVAVPAEKDNYEFILKSENNDIGDFTLSKLKIIGKIVGSVKLDEINEITI